MNKEEKEHDESLSGGWYSAEVITDKSPKKFIKELEEIEWDEIIVDELEWESQWEQYRFWVDFHWFSEQKVRKLLESSEIVTSYRVVDDNGLDT